jgi:ABC-type uncharacterized transport system permease subunit
MREYLANLSWLLGSIASEFLSYCSHRPQLAECVAQRVSFILATFAALVCVNLRDNLTLKCVSILLVASTTEIVHDSSNVY